jgi:hypothetical protein
MQALADLGVRPASGYLGQHLPLPGREWLEQLRRGVWPGLGPAMVPVNPTDADSPSASRTPATTLATRRTALRTVW